MASDLTEEEMLEQIALQITKNQIAYESKTEEEKKELTPKINMVVESQLGELKKEFNTILNSTGIVITPEIRIAVLQGIKDKILVEGTKKISDVFGTAEVINYVNNIVIQEDKRRQEMDALDYEHVSVSGFHGFVEMGDNGTIEENIINDVQTGKKWKFRNSNLGKIFSKEAGATSIEDLDVNERKIVDTVDKYNDRIEKLIKQANSSNSEERKQAQMILSITSTAIGFGDIEKKFSECDSIEKENALYALYNLGRLVQETDNEYATAVLEDCAGTLGLENFLEKDENGNVDLKLQEFARKAGFFIDSEKPRIMDEEFWIQGFVNYSDAEDFLTTSMIQTSRHMMEAESNFVTSLVMSKRMTLEEAKQVVKEKFSKNIDAANQTLMSLDSYAPNTVEGELYNYQIQVILEQYLNAPEGYKVDNFVMQDLLEGIDAVTRKDSFKDLEPRTLELLEQVVQRNMIMIKGSQKDVSYDDDLYKTYQEYYILIKEQLNQRNVNGDKTIDFEITDLVTRMKQIQESHGLNAAYEFTIDTLVSSQPKKEDLIGAALDLLEEQKTTEEFSSKESKNFRKELYESIVLLGIDKPEIFERMKSIDRETSKDVVNSMIEQVNSSRIELNKVVGAIQALGKNLNEPTEEKIIEDKPLGFLKIENVELPHVDMFGKDKDDDDSEPGER